MALNEDRRRIGSRLSVLQYSVVVLFSALAVGFWVLQVVQHEKFEEMAENNHQRTLALRAPRGIVFDRDGHVLVENRHAYSISIDRERSKDLNRTVTLLSSVLGVPEARRVCAQACERELSVAIVVRPGEDDDRDHRPSRRSLAHAGTGVPSSSSS